MVEIKEAIHRDVTRKFLQKGQRPTTRSRAFKVKHNKSPKSKAPTPSYKKRRVIELLR